jgi:hypothetical protein
MDVPLSPHNVRAPENYLDFPTKLGQHFPPVFDQNLKKEGGSMASWFPAV